MMPSAALRNDAKCDEVVHALEVNLLSFQFQMNAVKPLDPAIQVSDRNLCFLELRANRLREVVDDGVGCLSLGVDLRAQPLVRFRLEIPEGELLQLVLDLAHAEPVRDWSVDVERLLRHLQPALLRQMLQRPHVVETIGELDQNHPNVVHHREQHLAEVLRLTLLARRERNGADRRDAFDDVGDLRTEQLGNTLRSGERVFDHVVQKAGRHGHDVQFHVREEIGDFERVHQVGFAGMADLPLVFKRGEHVRPSQQFEVSLGAVTADFLEQGLEANHGNWCLTS
jgi:hypothetical protein